MSVFWLNLKFIFVVVHGGMAQSDSVTQWLRDLRDETELECMCVLQGKSLTKESADLVFLVPKSTKGEFSGKLEKSECRFR